MTKVSSSRSFCCPDPTTGFLFMKSFNKSGNFRLSGGSGSVLGALPGTLQTPLSDSRLESGWEKESGAPQEVCRNSSGRSGSSEKREFSREGVEESANKFVVSEEGGRESVEESVSQDEESEKSGSCGVRRFVGNEDDVSISLNMSASSER